MKIEEIPLVIDKVEGDLPHSYKCNMCNREFSKTKAETLPKGWIGAEQTGSYGTKVKVFCPEHAKLYTEDKPFTFDDCIKDFEEKNRQSLYALAPPAPTVSEKMRVKVIEFHPATECCSYRCNTTLPYPVMWNHYNKVVQCHNCGLVFTPKKC